MSIVTNRACRHLDIVEPGLECVRWDKASVTHRL